MSMLIVENGDAFIELYGSPGITRFVHRYHIGRMHPRISGSKVEVFDRSENKVQFSCIVDGRTGPVIERGVVGCELSETLDHPSTSGVWVWCRWGQWREWKKKRKDWVYDDDDVIIRVKNGKAHFIQRGFLAEKAGLI
jgi:hypothetical protein